MVPRAAGAVKCESESPVAARSPFQQLLFSVVIAIGAVEQYLPALERHEGRSARVDGRENMWVRRTIGLH